MSRKEVPRAGLLKAARAGKITNAQGALAMQLSVRQFQRVKVRFAAEGAGGLRHRPRGRPSPRRLLADVRTRRSSVRRLRRALGLPPKRRRRARPGRIRRTPEAQTGALVQLDLGAPSAATACALRSMRSGTVRELRTPEGACCALAVGIDCSG